MTDVPPPWTRPADVRETVRRKRGALLTRFAAGLDWEPMGIPVRGPGPAEIGERLGEVRQWVGEWERAARCLLRVEYKKVGGRHIGTNLIPGRAWIDDYSRAWALLGMGGEVSRFTELAERTGKECPRLLPWLTSRPVKVLQLADRWADLLATVRWIDEHQAPGMYLRQVDVPGVDTKFIERHRGVLAELLDLQLDPERIDPAATDFEGRYRFRRKPGYVRFRTAAEVAGYSELAVRAEEFTVPPPGVTRAYVIENEVTYLAFPLPPDAIVIWGVGYAVPLLESVGWLASLDVVYWGDIDTHGFAILNRLRRRFPHARSMLMDRATLFAHRDQWVSEPGPSAAILDMLDEPERALYRDLVTGALGAPVRLEQERISFAAIERAIRASSEG